MSEEFGIERMRSEPIRFGAVSGGTGDGGQPEEMKRKSGRA